MTAVSYKVVYTEPIPPAKLNPAISKHLEGTILKCLAKSPTDRYQTGEEIAQDLAAIRMGSTPTVFSTLAPAAGGNDLTLGPGQIALTKAPTHATGTGGSLPFPAAPPPSKKPARTTRIETIVVALIAVVVLGAGAWFYYSWRFKPVPPPQPAQNQSGNQTTTPTVQQPVTMQQAQSQPAPAAPSAKTPPSFGTSPSGTPPAASPKPAPAKPAAGKPSTPAATPPPAPTLPAAKPATPAEAPPTAPPATPAKVPAAFDPRKLDPNTNAKLKIEIAKFPNGIPFSVEMNGKPYTHFVTGDGGNLDNLFVPPGVQQFRIVMKSGGQEWDSNVLNDEFKAKKRQALKIQLTQKGKVVGKITLPISKDDDLFLSVSTSFADNLPF